MEGEANSSLFAMDVVQFQTIFGAEAGLSRVTRAHLQAPELSPRLTRHVYPVTGIPLELNSCIAPASLPLELLYGAKALYQELDSIARLLETPASGDDGTVELDWINLLIRIAKNLQAPINRGIFDSLGLPAPHLIPSSSPPVPTSNHYRYPAPSSYSPRPYLSIQEHDIFALLSVPNHPFPLGNQCPPTLTPSPLNSPHHANLVHAAPDPKWKGRCTNPFRNF